MTRRLSQDEIDRKASLAGIRLLEPYRSQTAKIEAECLTCGRRWQANPQSFCRGQGCQICAARRTAEKNRLPDDAAEQMLHDKGLELVGPCIGRHRGKQHVRCLACGDEHEVSVASLYDPGTDGGRCHRCEFKRCLEAFQRRLATLDLELVEIPRPVARGGLGNLFKVRCLRCKHTWTVKRPAGCPECEWERRTLTTSEIKKRLEANNLSLISFVTSSKVRVACLKCQHEFHVFGFSKKKLDRNGCPRCLRKERGSIPESEIMKLAERITGWKFRRDRPAWLKGRSCCPMELDGHNEEHRVAIEFQGPGHYTPVFGAAAFQTTRRNDERKRVLCYQHDVLLIRVPYWKADPEAFIRSKLVKAGLIPT